MQSSAATAAVACLALLAGGCTYTYIYASAGEPAGLASTSPPRALMCPGSLPTSTLPSAHARLSGSGESTPVTAVVGQRIVATVRSPYLPLRSIPQASAPRVLCYASAVRGRYAVPAVFAAWHPGTALVIAFAGFGTTRGSACSRSAPSFSIGAQLWRVDAGSGLAKPSRSDATAGSGLDAAARSGTMVRRG